MNVRSLAPRLGEKVFFLKPSFLSKILFCTNSLNFVQIAEISLTHDRRFLFKKVENLSNSSFFSQIPAFWKFFNFFVCLVLSRKEKAIFLVASSRAFF
jgi:hypothetical protein